MLLARLGTKRAVVLLCAVAAATLMVVLAVVAASKPAGAATDRLPDLGMDKLTNIQIQNQTNGQRWLRFDTKVVNIGAGAFEARGSRPDTSTPTMSVNQRIFDDAGGHRDVSTAAKMYYAGDGHNHWHLRNLETYWLIRLADGVKVGTGAKQGFCVFDNYRFGSTASRFYLGCAKDQPNALSVTMGLSRGWGDIYDWSTVGQYINVTNLPDGRYKLKAQADHNNWFQESNNSNNVTWADVQIAGNTVSVLRYGPSAQPISG
jgi:Lysyl oxidase